MKSHPRKTSRFDSAMDWIATALVAFVIWMLLSAMTAKKADAGTVCRVQKQVFAHSYAQPLAVAAPVDYQIGRNLQHEAQATYQLRQSDEYLELLQLRGFKAGVDAVTAVSGDRPTGPAGLAMKGGDNPAGGDQPPAEPADPYLVLKKTCAKCHSGENPKGDIWLDGSVPLDGPDAADKRDAIVAAIRTGHMPPSLKDGHRLDLEVREAIEDELYGVIAE